MMNCSGACVPRKPWELTFPALAEEVASLRRSLRNRLHSWGLHDLTDVAQLCVSELVSNVIVHVGAGTPVSLTISMRDTNLRVEVRDPDPTALPTLLNSPAPASESGRGILLVEALAVRWGVERLDHHKVTWCELATGLDSPHGHATRPGVVRAARLLTFYDSAATAGRPSRLSSTPASRLTPALMEATAIGAITDILHWLGAHGRDADEVLDRAQRRFEAGNSGPR